MTPIATALEHIAYCHARGMNPGMVLDSLGIAGTARPSWGEVLDALILWSAEFENDLAASREYLGRVA